MATKFQEGDRVQIVDREANPEDVKTSLFFNHYRGLVGTVQKIYPTEEVAVEVELASLPEAVAHRHNDVQEQMKSKWLDGLSEEARNRLTDQEKDFRLHYTILVSLKDLITPTTKAAAEDAPRRRTSAEIEAEEAAYLQRRRQQG
jgi:hypothetical protein